MIAELQEAVSALPLDEFYDAVVERTGYALALETKGGDENVTRLENIAELKSSIVKSVEANPDLDLYSYLDEVAPPWRCSTAQKPPSQNSKAKSCY